MKNLKLEFSFAKKIFFSFIIFSIFNFQIFSAGRSGQELILPTSWIYESLLTLEVESGIVTFSGQAPISIIELKSYLKDIKYESLSESGKRQYEKIQDFINEEGFSISYGPLFLSADLLINPEFFYKTQEAFEWNFDYTKRAPLLELPIKLGFEDYMTFFMGLQKGQPYTAMFRNDNYVNHFFGINEFDPSNVHQTYLSTGYTWKNDFGFNVRVAVGTQSYGHTLLPSVIMSEYLTDTPYINFRFFSPIFNYDFNVTQLTPKTSFYTHKINARFFKKFEIAFMEGVLLYDHFDLRLLSPLGIYHDYAYFLEYSDQTASYFGIKASFTPIKNLRIYGLFAQNENTLKSEADAGDTTPEGKAFQVGAETFFPTKNGHLHFGAEFYYALPYFLIKNSPNNSFERVYSEMISGSGNYYQRLGSPLGSDSLAFKIVAGYENPKKWGIKTSYTFAALGEFAGNKIYKASKWENTNFENYDKNYWDSVLNPYGTRAIDLKTPHGIPEYQNCISINVKYCPTDFLTVAIQPSYKFIYNFGNQSGNFKKGFEISLATKIEFSKIGNYKKTVSF